MSMLSFDESAFPGNGVYLADAITVLEGTPWSTLFSKTISILPRSSSAGTGLHCFGWEPDGAVINGVYSFIASAMVCCAGMEGMTLPTLLKRRLAAIGASFTMYESDSARLVSNLVETQAQRFANRTSNDPIFLAMEFQRCSFNHAHVKGFVKMYRNRTSFNGALAMPQRVEDATIRLMLPEKVSPTALASACPTNATCHTHSKVFSLCI